MGCCNCKPQVDTLTADLSTEEAKILQSELLHPFSLISVKSLYKEFLLNDRHSRIPIQNFRRACGHLEIPPEAVMSFKDFFNALKDTSGQFSTEKVILSCLVLGKGKLTQKLQLWFDFYDKSAAGYLTKDLVFKMVQGLLETGAQTLPLNAISTNDCSRLFKYIDSFDSFITTAADKYTDLILKNCPCVNYKDLCAVFEETKELQKIFSSQGIRTNLLKEIDWKANKKQKTVHHTRESSGFTHIPPFTNPNKNSLTEMLIEEDFVFQSESSNASSEVVIIQVKLHDRIENFVLHPDDDPLQAAREFSHKHRLSEDERTKLFQSMTQIHEHLTSS